MYENVQPELFDLEVDFSSDAIFEQNKLPIKINKSPDFLEQFALSPTEVEYIINTK